MVLNESTFWRFSNVGNTKEAKTVEIVFSKKDKGMRKIHKTPDGGGKKALTIMPEGTVKDRYKIARGPGKAPVTKTKIECKKNILF